MPLPFWQRQSLTLYVTSLAYLTKMCMHECNLHIYAYLQYMIAYIHVLLHINTYASHTQAICFCIHDAYATYALHYLRILLYIQCACLQFLAYMMGAMRIFHLLYAYMMYMSCTCLQILEDKFWTCSVLPPPYMLCLGLQSTLHPHPYWSQTAQAQAQQVTDGTCKQLLCWLGSMPPAQALCICVTKYLARVYALSIGVGHPGHSTRCITSYYIV